MKKVISVTKEQREFLCKAFGVTKQMVSYALNYNQTWGQSELAKKLRAMAIRRGGCVMVCAPESAVVYDADGMMRQHFENGMMWEGDKHTGRLELKDERGAVVECIEHATLRDIERVQARVSALCCLQPDADGQGVLSDESARMA